MKMKQKMAARLEQTMVQGFDMQMIQRIQCLPGPQFADFVEEFCLENKAVRLMHNYSKPIVVDFSTIYKEESLFEHLVYQIEISFNQEEKEEAVSIAGDLDKDGFYSGEITPVVKKMWKLDPVGVATLSPKEALLIQLQELGKENSLAYLILSRAYKHFLLKDFGKIARQFLVSLEEVYLAIEQIKVLHPFPGRGFGSFQENYVTAEMQLTFDGKWHLCFVKEFYPTCKIVKNSSGKARQDAKKFMYQLHKRKERLEYIVAVIVKKQGAYLLGEKDLLPLLRKDLLKRLDISESTLSRILSEKYIETPIGIFSLGHFFTKSSGSIAEDGSVKKAKRILKELIEAENKKKPYADELLRKLLLTKGIVCSRRSIAKYRKALSIPGVYHRALR
jgi:RNA polymerase sigma-54 factor